MQESNKKRGRPAKQSLLQQEQDDKDPANRSLSPRQSKGKDLTGLLWSRVLSFNKKALPVAKCFEIERDMLIQKDIAADDQDQIKSKNVLIFEPLQFK